MKLNKSFQLFTFLLITFSAVFSQNSYANKKALSENIKVVIHVSHSGKSIYRAALNYAYHIRNKYGDNATIAIVANGPGIGLLNANNSYKNQISSLMIKNVEVTACNTTISALKAMNKPIPIVKGVEIVPAGIVRVLELQQQGYLYLQP